MSLYEQMMNKKFKFNFALIGLGGYIAPRHVEAIKKNNCNLSCSLDINDSVGFIENYFPNSHFFTEIGRFDRYIDKISRTKDKISYVSICSPNYLHDSHIRLGLRSKSHVICEKPLVINPWNLDAIEKMQREYKKKVYSINQLRLHPSIIKLKQKIQNSKKLHDVEITYITPRGNWYKYSWKGDKNKSGGLLYNIGIHLFDLINFLFGKIEITKVNFASENCYSGFISTKKANIRYFLSIDKNHLNLVGRKKTNNPVKILKVDDEKINLSKNFVNLHTLSYKKILEKKGFEINSIRSGIELTYKIKKSIVSSPNLDSHPLVNKIK